MINNPLPFKGLNVRIPIVIPIEGRGLVNHGTTLGFRVWEPVASGGECWRVGMAVLLS